LAIIEQHDIPTMGALRLSEVTASDVQAAVAAWMDAGLSATTVGHHYDIVRGAFGWAVDSGQLARNPALAATPPPRARREMVAWEPDHCRVALEALGNSTIYLPVLMGLATGMRRGEVCALDWREVDLSKGRLRVVRTLTQTSDGLEFCDPKTAACRREIPMPPALTSELRAIRKMQAQNKLAMRGTYADNGLVYCDPDGSPHKPDSLSGTFSNWIRRHHDRLELPVIGFHGLRHTYASLLLAAGVDLKTIAKLMGHTNVGFTLHTYAHVMRGSEEAAAEAVSAAIAGSGH
jgi:integrase